MAIGVSSQGGGRGGRRGRRTKPMSEPNVIPLVDVMLVLLIIFMVAAPLLTAGVKVDLPKTAASELRDQSEPLTVTIKGSGQIYLQETEVTGDDLAPRLKAMLVANPNLPIYVRADKTASWERVAQIMGILNAAGFAKIALVTQPLNQP